MAKYPGFPDWTFIGLSDEPLGWREVTGEPPDWFEELPGPDKIVWLADARAVLIFCVEDSISDWLDPVFDTVRYGPYLHVLVVKYSLDVHLCQAIVDMRRHIDCVRPKGWIVREMHKHRLLPHPISWPF